MKFNVLILADDEQVIGALEMGLKGAAITPFFARNFEAATRLFSALAIDLVVSDLNLRDGCGLEMAKLVEREGDAKIPLLVLATHETKVSPLLISAGVRFLSRDDLATVVREIRERAIRGGNESPRRP